MNEVQQFEKIVKQRRSVRGFLSSPVPEDTLKSIFTLAGFAPSNCNTQPWVVHVASGESCKVLRQRLPEALMAGEFDMDFPYDGTYQGVYKERQHDAARQLYGAMGVTREDKAARQAAFFQNFQFFNAPHVAFLFLPADFGIREACDLGMYAQTLMLAMQAQGVDSCPQTALGFNAGLVKDVLSVDPEMKLMFGISFGYKDPSVPANEARVGRAALEDYVKFHG